MDRALPPTDRPRNTACALHGSSSIGPWYRYHGRMDSEGVSIRYVTSSLETPMHCRSVLGRRTCSSLNPCSRLADRFIWPPSICPDFAVPSGETRSADVPAPDETRLDHRTLEFAARGGLAERVNSAAPLANNRLFDAKGGPVSFAGQITTLSTSPRQLQLGLKLIW